MSTAMVANKVEMHYHVLVSNNKDTVYMTKELDNHVDVIVSAIEVKKMVKAMQDIGEWPDAKITLKHTMYTYYEIT